LKYKDPERQCRLGDVYSAHRKSGKNGPFLIIELDHDGYFCVPGYTGHFAGLGQDIHGMKCQSCSIAVWYQPKFSDEDFDHGEQRHQKCMNDAVQKVLAGLPGAVQAQLSDIVVAVMIYFEPVPFTQVEEEIIGYTMFHYNEAEWHSWDEKHPITQLGYISEDDTKKIADARMSEETGNAYMRAVGVRDFRLEQVYEEGLPMDRLWSQIDWDAAQAKAITMGRSNISTIVWQGVPSFALSTQTRAHGYLNRFINQYGRAQSSCGPPISVSSQATEVTQTVRKLTVATPDTIARRNEADILRPLNAGDDRLNTTRPLERFLSGEITSMIGRKRKRDDRHTDQVDLESRSKRVQIDNEAPNRPIIQPKAPSRAAYPGMQSERPGFDRASSRGQHNAPSDQAVRISQSKAAVHTWKMPKNAGTLDTPKTRKTRRGGRFGGSRY
jgi:hypothetical protein